MLIACFRIQGEVADRGKSNHSRLIYLTGCLEPRDSKQYNVMYSTLKNQFTCRLSPVRYSNCSDHTGNYRMWRLGCVFQLRPYPLIAVENDILAKERRKVPCRYDSLVTLFPHLPSPTFSYNGRCGNGNCIQYHI